MLRIHFTTEDLARTRIAATWGPLGETMLSLAALQDDCGQGLFGGWRQRLRKESPLATHPFTGLFDGGVLDLFTVTGRTDTLEEGLESLLAAHPRHMHAELTGAVEGRTLYAAGRRWRGPLREDFAHDPEDRKALVCFLRDYHRTAVAPHWSRVHSRLQAEQADRARTLALHGVEGMLAALPRGFRWRPPVLEIGRGTPARNLELGGRGLILVPSVFGRSRDGAFTHTMDEQAPVLLFLPVLHTAADAAHVLTGPGTAGTRKVLADLLGRTRANALDAIGQSPCTTGLLAQRLTVSPATASEHATVLRGAGLVTTTRQGSTVLHALTPLGAALLTGSVAAPAPGRPG